MTEPDTPGAETGASTLRPVDWPLWRRIRLFGGVGLVCTVIALLIELLFADVHGGRAVNVYDTLGWTDLRGVLWGLALALPASGLMIAVALPLYRWRYGGVLVGLLGYCAFLAGIIAGMSIGAPHHPDPGPLDTLEIVQLLVGFVGFGVMAVAIGQEARSLALGEPDADSSFSWPSW